MRPVLASGRHNKIPVSVRQVCDALCACFFFTNLSCMDDKLFWIHALCLLFYGEKKRMCRNRFCFLFKLEVPIWKDGMMWIDHIIVSLVCHHSNSCAVTNLLLLLILMTLGTGTVCCLFFSSQIPASRKSNWAVELAKFNFDMVVSHINAHVLNTKFYIFFLFSDSNF